jgi:hypothetical protein
MSAESQRCYFNALDVLRVPSSFVRSPMLPPSVVMINIMDSAEKTLADSKLELINVGVIEQTVYI